MLPVTRLKDDVECPQLHTSVKVTCSSGSRVTVWMKKMPSRLIVTRSSPGNRGLAFCCREGPGDGVGEGQDTGRNGPFCGFLTLFRQ